MPRLHRMIASAALASTLLSWDVAPAPLAAQSIGLSLRDSAQVLTLTGSTVRVPVLLDFTSAGTANLAALQATMAWDATLLRFDSLRAAPGREITLLAETGGAASGGLQFSAFGPVGLRESGALAEAFFTARSSSGGSWLTLLPAVAGNEQGQSVLPLLRTRQLGVCVSPDAGLWGDGTGEGLVNILDAQQLARYAVGLSVIQPVVVAARGDVTADGKIDVLDAQQVARYSVGLSAVDRVGKSAYTPPAVTALALDRDWRITLPLENWLQVTATPRDGAGAPLPGCQPVSWSSNNPGVATVTATGQVTAVAPGTATLTVQGNGRTASVPVTVQGLPPTQTLVVGGSGACRLSASGTVVCWGNWQGIATPTPVPTAVASPVPLAGLAATWGRCGLTPTGQAYCWGQNTTGEVGDGTLLPRNAPTAMRTGLVFTRLAVAGGGAQGGAACGLTTQGKAYCWGWNLQSGLGDGTAVDRLFPVAVQGGLTFSSIATDWLHTCALTPAGQAYCWGANWSGSIGDGSSSGRTAPVPVAGDLVLAQLETGWYHTCGLTVEGIAYCWGTNTSGELGDGTTQSRLVPTPVAGGLRFSSLSAGNARTCGITLQGAAYCWGRSRKQADAFTIVNESVLIPTPVPGGLAFSLLQTGTDLTCGLTTGGQAYCWGRNTSGEVGDGTTVERLVPTQVLGNGFAAGGSAP